MDDEKKVIKELERKYNQKSPNYFFKGFKDNLNKIAIALIGIIYIGYGAFQLSTREDASIVEIIGNISISLFVGIAIALCMRRDGLKSGRRSDIFMEANAEYVATRSRIAPNLDKLSAFCIIKNKNDLEEAKRNTIEEAGLNYKAWINGFYKDYDKEKLTDEQKKALIEVEHIKIERLTSSVLLSDSPKMSARKLAKYGRFGKNSEQFLAEKTIGNLATSLMWAIVFGYFTFKFVGDSDTLSQVVWNLFQMILWLTNGVIKYFDARDFMVNEYCETHIVAKTQYLKEFEATLINNPSLIIKYSADEEIEEFLKKKESEDNGNSGQVQENS